MTSSLARKQLLEAGQKFYVTKIRVRWMCFPFSYPVSLAKECITHPTNGVAQELVSVLLVQYEYVQFRPQNVILLGRAICAETSKEKLLALAKVVSLMPATTNSGYAKMYLKFLVSLFFLVSANLIFSNF